MYLAKDPKDLVIQFFRKKKTWMGAEVRVPTCEPSQMAIPLYLLRTGLVLEGMVIFTQQLLSVYIINIRGEKKGRKIVNIYLV